VIRIKLRLIFVIIFLITSSINVAQIVFQRSVASVKEILYSLASLIAFLATPPETTIVLGGVRTEDPWNIVCRKIVSSGIQLSTQQVAQESKPGTIFYLYTDKQIEHWLSWLACMINQNVETQFFTENIQPQWLKDRSLLRRLYVSYVRLAGMIIFGALGGVILWRTFGVLGILAFSIVGVLVFSLDVDIDLSNVIIWSWSGVIPGIGEPRMLLIYIPLMLVFSVIGLLIEKFVSVLLLMLVYIMSIILIGGYLGNTNSTENDNTHRIRAKAISTFGLIFGLGIIGAVLGLFVDHAGLVAQLFGEENGALLGTVFVGFVGGIFFGVLGGLILKQVSGLEALIQHIILRIFLVAKGYMPLRFESFVTKACNMKLLARGPKGGIQFADSSIQEYFQKKTVC